MTRIIRKTLGQEAVEIVREMIVNEELKPGDGIVEQEVADQIGVSRGPVREALHQLEQEGLVEYVPNRGCFVREVSKMDILETALLQIQLELSVLELLDGKLPDETIKILEKITSEMGSGKEGFTFRKMLEEDKNFHRSIMQAFPFRKMLRIWDSLNQGNLVTSRWFLRDEESLLKVHRKIHEELLNALKTKDMAVIRHAMMKHCVDGVGSQVSKEDLGIDLEVLLK